MKLLALTALLVALAAAPAAKAQLSGNCLVANNNRADWCATGFCDPVTGCSKCATSTARNAPKMRVLNNGAGTLAYNRCTSCDASELKCKDALACAPGANGALDGCTACKSGWFLDTTTPVPVKYIDAGTEATKDYRGCRSCAEAFGCLVGAGCDANGCLVCPQSKPFKHWKTKRCSTCVETSGAGCLQCYTNGDCKTCARGYYKDAQNRCQVCSRTNCEACSSTGTCATCKKGYYVDADGNCAACTLTGCAQCASPGGDTCEQCQKGFYTPTDAPGTCANCTIANCVQCAGATTDDAPTCATCARGYNFITASNECRRCRETGGDKCITCATDGTGFCTKCWDRWSVDSTTGQCASCALIGGPACLTCDPAAPACLTCAPGTYLNSTGGCSSCAAVGAACKACTVDETDDTLKCTSCPSGAYVDDTGVCGYCAATYGSYCRACDATQCTTCQSGSYWDATTAKCVSCTATWGSNCKACTSTACTSCPRRYSVGSDGKCKYTGRR